MIWNFFFWVFCIFAYVYMSIQGPNYVLEY